MNTPAGILFSQDVLAETWFQVLATAVAFNSLVFLGMTVAKLIPWPQQFHPDWVADRLGKIGVVMSMDDSREEVSKRDQTRVSDGTVVAEEKPFEAIRNAIIIRDVPWAIAVVGVISGGLALVDLLIYPDSDFGGALVLPMAVVWLALGVGLGRSSVGANVRSWIWVAVVAVEVTALAVITERVSQGVIFAPSLILMSVYAPLAMRWRPALVGGAVMVVFFSLEIASLGFTSLGWLLTGLVAVGASCVLLRLRLITVESLANERVAINAVSTINPVTGAYSRQGILPLIPGVAGSAHRMKQPVRVTLLKIDNLAQLRDQYGVGYTNELAANLADVARRTSNLGDLVASWSQDCLLVVGFGDDTSHQRMMRELASAASGLEMTLGKQKTKISLGSVSGDPLSTTFDSMVLEAEGTFAPLK